MSGHVRPGVSSIGHPLATGQAAGHGERNAPGATDRPPAEQRALFYGLAGAVVTLIAWFAILFTGKYPRGMFDFVVGLFRWQMRVNAYLLLLTDAYPPFNGKE